MPNEFRNGVKIGHEKAPLFSDYPKPNYSVEQLEQALDKAKKWESMSEAEQHNLISAYMQEIKCISQEKVDIIDGDLQSYVLESGKLHTVFRDLWRMSGKLYSQKNGEFVDEIHTDAYRMGHLTRDNGVHSSEFIPTETHEEMIDRLMNNFRNEVQSTIKQYEQEFVEQRKRERLNNIRFEHLEPWEQEFIEEGIQAGGKKFKNMRKEVNAAYGSKLVREYMAGRSKDFDMCCK